MSANYLEKLKVGERAHLMNNKLTVTDQMLNQQRDRQEKGEKMKMRKVLQNRKRRNGKATQANVRELLLLNKYFFIKFRQRVILKLLFFLAKRTFKMRVLYMIQTVHNILRGPTDFA